MPAKFLSLRPVVAILAICLCIGCPQSQADETRDHFLETVVPLFEKHCLRCHNDDARKGDFSLSSCESFRQSQDVVDFSAPSESHLLALLESENGRAEMPQDSPALSPEEVFAIRRWLMDGAAWPEEKLLEASELDKFAWWSYQPIESVEIPRVVATQPYAEWISTPIDAFVLQKLKEHNLAPSPRADNAKLIRRLYYDLTGLPPTPDEVESFVADTSPQAYERLVDRLLGSAHYGERWARHWLDVAKYADTCGYDKDKLRLNAWPYRDYVIRSFNEDKAYRRFVREQIAGDILFPGEPDGVLGLGFIAAGPWDHIGHVEVSEAKIDGKVARYLDRDDMVSNAVNTFSSVTVQCARCHDHKFDPITQENYFGLQAIFAAVDRAERPYDLEPEIENRRSELKELIQRQHAIADDVNQAISQEGGPRLEELKHAITALQVEFEKPEQHGYHSALTDNPKEEKWVELQFEKPCQVDGVELYPCYDDFGGIGAGFGFPVRFRLEFANQDGRWQEIADHTDRDFPNPGLAPVTFPFAGSSLQRLRITATRLADRRGKFHFALAEVRVKDSNGAPIQSVCRVASKDSIESPARWSRENLLDGKWSRHKDPNKSDELVRLAAEYRDLVLRISSPQRIAQRQAALTAISQAEKELEELPAGKLVYAAATDFKSQGNFKPTQGKMREVRVLHRGNVQQPQEIAEPGVLPLSADDEWRIVNSGGEGDRRAELANWLTSAENPLVWRSIVNRIWQYHFGKGIVDTPNDFGRMGSLPSHPGLLDWIAGEFREKQSIKELHRLIVTSSVYQQSSIENPLGMKVDRSNRWLWRMPRRRLEAEEIRDSILAVSGTLRAQFGGPGFFLFELEKAEHSPHYEYHKFDPSQPSSHRRSIYRFVVRSQPDPWMTTLDCADSSQSTPVRSETLTPIQALALLNNKLNLTMASTFAKRLKLETNELSKQIRNALFLAFQREPTPNECEELIAYADEFGLENACRVILNLSEFIFVD